MAVPTHPFFCFIIRGVMDQQPASYNYTIDDTSSVLTYTPYGDGVFVNNGWEAWFSQSGFNTAGGQESIGDSRHLTSFAGASVSLQFHGTAVYVYGNASCPFEFSLDNDPVPSSNSPTSTEILFVLTGLVPGTHFLKITAQPPQTGQGTLFFDKAIITDVLPSGATSTVSELVDNQNTTALLYQGTWVTKTDVQIPSRASPKPFKQTQDPAGSVSLNFTGAIAVAIDGNRNWGHSLYNMSLNGASELYNASTFWLMSNTVLYYQSGLDPKTNYTLKMINAGGAGSTMTINDFTLFSPNLTSTGSSGGDTSVSNNSHKSHVGVIVGPIVGVVGFIVIVIAAFFFWRKQVNSKQATEEAGQQAMPFPPSLSTSDSSISKRPIRSQTSLQQMSQVNQLAPSSSSISQSQTQTTNASTVPPTVVPAEAVASTSASTPPPQAALNHSVAAEIQRVLNMFGFNNNTSSETAPPPYEER
ncbi:hypothetical protein ABKN59_002704 [Abortiporus biennis]